MNKNILLISFLIVILFSCSSKKETKISRDPNPAAEGFNVSQSDKKAIAIADSAMKAMGGREGYDQLRYISWNFFGSRDLIWDKHTGRVRIDFPAKKTTYLLNIDSMEGRVMKDSVEITNADSLKTYVNKGKSIWINDSYWLVMPFKLKDSGVTLKYNREDTLPDGATADVLTLTFENIGNTPDNKYEVYVDQADHLVKQWAYFKSASQDTASAVWPWDNYKKYQGVMLSADRSDGKGPANVKVYDELPEKVFTSFKKPLLN